MSKVTGLLLDYAEIPLCVLQSGNICGFDIYIKGKEGYTLLASRHIPISQKLLSKLREANLKNVYIQKSDEEQYMCYLSEHMPKFSGDDSMKREQKAELIYNSARNIMRGLFEKPNTPQLINSVKNAAGAIMDTILDDEKAFLSLVQVSSYDYHTYTHSINVAIYSIGIGKFMGLAAEDLRLLAAGAALHDLGKSRIDQQILNKPAKLSHDEFEKMKEHPDNGIHILKSFGNVDEGIAAAVLHHHEKFDGSGYPHALVGNQIPLFGQIVAIADIFDALNTKRCYKAEMSTFDTLQFMKTNMSNHLNTKILTQFIRCMSGAVV